MKNKTVRRFPMAGLAGLEILSISWNANDNPNEPESLLALLYELNPPTLTTLVTLRMDNQPQVFRGDFDLQLLKPTADADVRIHSSKCR